MLWATSKVQEVLIMVFTDAALNVKALGRVVFFFFSFCLFFFAGAIPSTHGGSQARGWIGAVATSHSHSNAGCEPHLQPTPHFTATPDPYLTHWAMPGIKPASSWMLVEFVNHWATMETPSGKFFSSWLFHALFNVCICSF